MATGTRKTLLQRILSIVGIVLCAVSIVTLTFQVLLTPLPTTVFANATVRDDISSADHDYLVHIAEQTLAYCIGDPNAQLPLGTDETTAFTSDVMGHLDDVKGFFLGTRTAAVVASVALAVCLIALFITAHRRRRNAGAAPFSLLVSRVLLGGCLLVVAVVALVAVAAVMDFNSLFNLLHSFFFSSGSWLFAYDSLLICALPEAFWMSMGILWGAVLVVTVVVLLLLSRLLRRHARARAAVR